MSATLYGCGAVEPAKRPGAALRWQYVRVQVSITEIATSDPLLERLGLDGWELAATSSNDSYLHLWFKRQA